MGFSVAGVFLFAAVSFWWTSQPSFCDRCHVMEPYVAEWKQSVHRDVNCENCHLTPGFFGYLGGKISGTPGGRQLHPRRLRGLVIQRGGLQRRLPAMSRIILAGNIHDASTGITVSHENIIEMGAKCMQCHSTVAHGSAVAVGIGRPTRPWRRASHVTTTRSHRSTCDLCHIG